MIHRDVCGCFNFQVRLEDVAVITGSVMMVPVLSIHGDVMEKVTAWMDLMRWPAVSALYFVVGTVRKLLNTFNWAIIMLDCLGFTVSVTKMQTMLVKLVGHLYHLIKRKPSAFQGCKSCSLGYFIYKIGVLNLY